jgi:CheY-like chemotaxis protein
LPIIKADAGQLQQVIMNLITNAAEAIGDASGTITLSTGVGEFDHSVMNESCLDEKPEAGRYVWLEVCDNGCGMDGETVRKIFDPFFTTKFTGRGLGMSAVLGIVRAHKGAFLVDSVPGAGTTIRVLFPAMADRTAEPAPVSESDNGPEQRIGRSLRVLVVDDEEMIRDISAAMLAELGFEALTAAGGEEALALFQENGGSIDIVLLDQIMPGMDGVSVFKELRRLRPDITVLLASGFSHQEVAERFKGLGLNGFIPKPYTLKSLATELSRVLEGADT